jgi:alpha-D-ribose 1-methylphosphonate 5-triphosphate synthase subunit PhnH
MAAPPAPGFTDPVRDAQAVFRAVLDALARPGIPRPLPSGLKPPAPLTPELAAVALALADPDTPVWLDTTLAASPDVAAFLRFQTGAPMTLDAGEAAFALLRDPSGLPPFDVFAQGSPEYPDRSTTIVVAVERFADAPPIRLTGPGVKGWASFAARRCPRFRGATRRQSRPLPARDRLPARRRRAGPRPAPVERARRRGRGGRLMYVA